MPVTRTIRINMNQPDFRELIKKWKKDVDPLYFIIGTISIAKRWSLQKSFRAWILCKSIERLPSEANKWAIPQQLNRGNKYIKATSDDDEVKESEISPELDYRTLMDYPYIEFAGFLLKGYDIGEAANASVKMASKVVPIEEINAILAINNDTDLIEAFGNLWASRVDENEMC